jgi:hypothetical protein
MAITATKLTSSGNTTDLNQYAPASVTPASLALILVTVAVSHLSAAPTASIDGTALGMTFTEIDPVNANRSFDAGVKRIQVFRGMAASPTAGQIVINLDAVATGCAWSIDEFTGVKTSGVNGADAIRQVVMAAGNGSQVATLATFGDAANNVTFGAIGGNTNSTPIVVSPFVELGKNNGASPGRNLLTQYAPGENLSVGNGMAGASQIGIVAAEIVAAAAGAPVYAYQQQ